MATLANGRVGIAYTDATTASLRYVYALNDQGTNWSVPQTLESFGIDSNTISLAVISGNPAVAYYHNGLKDALYVRATSPVGATWGSPLVIEVTPADDGQRICLAEINGRPAVMFARSGTDLCYARSTDATGGAWIPGFVLGGSLNGGDTAPLALASVNGNPAVAFTRNSGTGLLFYMRATDPDGVNTWAHYLLVASAPAGHITAPKLTVIGGIPLITYLRDDTFQYLARGNDYAGNGWSNEQILATEGAPPDATSVLLDCQGLPGVAQGDYAGGTVHFGTKF
jgi:hypothetical protein